MKKILLLMLMCFIHLASDAQMSVTPSIDWHSPYDPALSIPSEFCYDKTPKLTIYDSSDKDIKVYDENLSLVKDIDVSQSRTFDYQLTYKKETREVKEIKATSVEETSTGRTYEQFVEQELMYDPSLSQNSFSVSLNSQGDSVIIIKRNSYNYESPDQLYFGYSYFGTKYPRTVFKIKNGIVIQCRTKYEVTYTEWKDAGTETTDYHINIDPIRLCNVNLNNDADQSRYYFLISQTLFNDDDAYEYICPKYKLTGNSSSSNQDPVTDVTTGDETVELERRTLVTTESNPTICGVQIYSSDGNIIGDLDFDFSGSLRTYTSYVITIGSNVYLAFDGQDANGSSSTIFYKLNKSATGIKKVKKVSGTMTVFPSVSERNTAFTVNFKDDNSIGSELVITSVSGTQLSKYAIPAGVKTMNFNISAPSGIYIVSRIQKGKIKEVQKIIVK